SYRGPLDPPDGVEAGGEIVHRGPSVEGCGSGGAELFAPALLLLDVLVVGELFEIGLVGDPPYLEDDSRTHRCPTRPLGGLVLRRDIEDPEPVEQLVDLPVRAVRDDGLLAVVVDDE